MAKLYWTKDIKQLVDKKVDETGSLIIHDKEITREQAFRFIDEIRIFEKYAYEMIEEMEEADRKEEEETAEWKAQKEEQENAAAT